MDPMEGTPVEGPWRRRRCSIGSVVVVGTGLIGTSIALALRQRGVRDRVSN